MKTPSLPLSMRVVTQRSATRRKFLGFSAVHGEGQAVHRILLLIHHLYRCCCRCYCCYCCWDDDSCGGLLIGFVCAAP